MLKCRKASSTVQKKTDFIPSPAQTASEGAFSISYWLNIHNWPFHQSLVDISKDQNGGLTSSNLKWRFRNTKLKENAIKQQSKRSVDCTLAVLHSPVCLKFWKNPHEVASEQCRMITALYIWKKRALQSQSKSHSWCFTDNLNRHLQVKLLQKETKNDRLMWGLLVEEWK